MKKKTEILIEQIKKLLISYGYTQDTYGNFKKQKDGELYRYKFQSASLRKEVQYKRSDGVSAWVRLSSNYYNNLSIVNNKIVGLKRGF